MGPVELSALVTENIKPFLSYLLTNEEEINHKFDGEEEKIWEMARLLWQKLLPKFKAKVAAKEALEDVVVLPGDEDAWASLRLQIKKLFFEDELLVKEISEIIEEKRSNTTAIVKLEKQVDLLSPRCINQLPADIKDFVGREDEIKEILEFLDDGCRYINISGTSPESGLGKSTLAVHMAHKAKKNYHEGQILVNMQGTSKKSAKPAEVMANIIHIFKPSLILPPKELTQLYKDTLIGHKVLIVIDNASDAAHVRSLLPPYPSLLIVTSIRPIGLTEMKGVNIDPMSKSESCNLLENIMGSRTDLTKRDFDVLANACKYLPLVLRVAGAFMEMHPEYTVKEYTRDFSYEHRKRALSKINPVIWYSARHLLKERAEIVKRWNLLLVFPASLEHNAAGEIWKTGGKETLETLNKLVDYGLLLHNKASDRYYFHELMRSVAENVFCEEKEKESTKERMEEALGCHATYYESVARIANELYLKGGEDLASGVDLFDIEWPNIRAGHSWAEANTIKNEAAAGLCCSFSEAEQLLSIRQNPNDEIRWLESALSASRILKQRNSQGECLEKLGNVYKILKEPRRTLEFFDKALDIARELKNKENEGSILVKLGSAYAVLAEPGMAGSSYDKALKIVRQLGKRESEGKILGKMGSVYVAMDEPGKAVEFFEKALAIAREVGNSKGEENTLGNLGLVYASMGKYRDAIKYYEETLYISRKSGNRCNEGSTLGNLGFSYESLGELHRAIEFYSQSLVIAREINSVRGEGNMLGNLGNIYNKINEQHKSVKFYKEAIALHRKIDSLHGEGNALLGLGEVYSNLNKFKSAIDLYEEGLTLHRKTGNLRGESKALWKIGLLLEKQGSRNQGIAYVKAALNVADQAPGDTDYEMMSQKLAQWSRDKGWRRWLGFSQKQNDCETGILE